MQTFKPAIMVRPSASGIAKSPIFIRILPLGQEFTGGVG
jgi:hypothetical protein